MNQEQAAEAYAEYLAGVAGVNVVLEGSALTPVLPTAFFFPVLQS